MCSAGDIRRKHISFCFYHCDIPSMFADHGILQRKLEHDTKEANKSDTKASTKPKADVDATLHSLVTKYALMYFRLQYGRTTCHGKVFGVGVLPESKHAASSLASRTTVAIKHVHADAGFVGAHNVDAAAASSPPQLVPAEAGMFGMDAEPGQQMLQQSLAHVPRLFPIYFLRIVNMSPNRRKRMRVRDAEDLSVADVAVTFHACSSIDPAGKSCLVDVSPTFADGSVGDQGSPLCIWSLPSGLGIAGMTRSLVEWTVSADVKVHAKPEFQVTSNMNEVLAE